MKKALVVCVILFVSLAAGVAMAADPVTPTGMKAVDAAWTKAMLAGDAAAAAALYADDAVLVLPGSSAIKGKKAIAEAYEGWLKDVKVTDIVLSDTHYRTAGHLSAGWGQWKMTTVPKAGGAAKTETGTFCAVGAEKDGVWKYVSDHASGDPPAPAPAPKK
jgi:uncharacterized protein (TIGR02246 family)